MSDFINLNGKTALVIGHTQSLGLVTGIAARLAEAGAHVIRAGERTGADNQIVGLTLHDPVALRAEVAALGPLHTVIIAPGWYGRAAFLDSTVEHWDTALERNFEQAVWALQAAGHHLINQGRGGRIIVLSSVATLKALPGFSALGASLAALHIIARMAAVDFGPHHITVNVLAMGWLDDAWDADYVNTQTQPHLTPTIPAGRLTHTRDVADACALLMIEQAGHITGSVIPVDGGYSIHKASVPPPPLANTGS